MGRWPDCRCREDVDSSCFRDESLKGIQIKIVVARLIIAALAATMSLLVSRRVSRPLEKMKEGARRFAQGELESKLPLPESEERGGLGGCVTVESSRGDGSTFQMQPPVKP